MVAMVSDHDMGSEQDIFLQDHLLPCSDDIIRSDMDVIADFNNRLSCFRIIGMDEDVRIPPNRHIVPDARYTGASRYGPPERGRHSAHSS